MATEKGLYLEPFSQTIGNYNKPTKEFERLIYSNKIVIQNNDITKWMINNVVLKIDHNQNIKPDKGLKRKKIDGVMSMLMALNGFLDTNKLITDII